ncbi:MAG: glycosyltransferase [Bacteroidota bacterium]
MINLKISGFTFVRNAFLLGYPLEESINSLLPLCDELIIAAGESDDNTMDFVKNLKNDKIRIIESKWDENLRQAGLIYSQQTNIALAECTGDWCFYLQADEVVHERDYEKILRDINSADKHPEIDAILFRYYHFYGSYDFIGSGRQWYRREIRAFRNTKNVISWGDAQGFRKNINNKISKLNALQTDSYIYHYGWVRPPKIQNLKIKTSHTYYSNDLGYEIDTKEQAKFDYNSAFELKMFTAQHPEVMNRKIERDKEWTIFFDNSKLKRKPLIVKLSDWLEAKSGVRIGEFKDFIEIKI